MVDKEYLNFLKRCKNPLFILNTMVFVLKKVGQKLFRPRYCSIRHYPKNIRDYVTQYKTFVNNQQPCKFINSVFTDNFEKKLKLATGYLTYKGAPDWLGVWPDGEQIESLHRWGWLIFELTENPASANFEWGVNLMRSWLFQMDALPAGLASTSYTVSERIANACIFVACCREKKHQQMTLPDDIKFALKQMLNYLVDNLEYHKPLTNCNHIINNARALFFAGQELNLPEATKLALEILKNDLKRLITLDGFLNNGSSHYHLLFTRWLLEIYWCAERSTHDEIKKLLKPILELLLKRCSFYLVFDKTNNSWQLPLFGDVSPDCEPDWLIFLPWSRIARQIYDPRDSCGGQVRGWANLWERTSNEIKQTEENIFCGRPILQSFERSLWHRLDFQETTVFWHMESALSNKPGVHGHNDFGSFVVFYCGQPVLIDIGRYNYEQSEALSVYAASANAHNILTIDDLEPMINHNYQRLPDFYRAIATTINWRKEREQATFTLEHNGFSRLAGNKIKHIRRFIIRQNSLMIEDKLAGTGKHQVKTFFHFSPDCSLEQEHNKNLSFKIQSKHSTLSVGLEKVNSNPTTVQSRTEIHFGQTTPFVSGWFFPSFGMKSKISTLTFFDFVNLPFRTSYNIKFTK